MKLLPPTKTIVEHFGLAPNGHIQRLFVHECRVRMDKYVPMRDGNLADNVREGENYVDYNQPYAHYQYMGISKNGKEFNYSKDKHPLATSRWDVHMWTSERKEIVETLQRELKK